MISAIPSPSSSDFSLGPLTIQLYGLCIAVAVIVVVLIVRQRLAGRNLDPDRAIILAWVTVPAGLVGARIYHVVTDWKLYQDNWGDVVKVWEGGLGIPGGVAAGLLAGWALCRAMKWSFADMADVVAPALLVGQAIGRLGNWFNQELFGRPTELPWGLEIDLLNVPVQYRADAIAGELTFHPTFLYEALWNLAIFGVLLWLDRLRKLPPGGLVACYVMGYATGRIWIELLRIDRASELAGVRVNVWVMSALWLGALVWLLWLRGRAKADGSRSARSGAGVDVVAGAVAGTGAGPATAAPDSEGDDRRDQV